MSNKGQIYNDNYFNGWVIVGIFISIFVMMFMANEISSSPDDEIIFEIMIVLHSLVIIGAVSILIGMVRLGAILIIIGGLAMVPIGMIAAIGGFKILQVIENNKHITEISGGQATSLAVETGSTFDQQLIDTQQSIKTNKEAVENPLLEVKAEHYGALLPMGLLMTFSGFVIMLLELARGDILLGFGVLNIAFAFIANNSKARLFTDHMEVKISFNEWRYILYDDVISLDFQSDRDMKLEYKFGDKEKAIVFARSLWGGRVVKQIFVFITEGVESDILNVPPSKRYMPIGATIISIEQNKDDGVNGTIPYQIHTRWKEPDSGEMHLFKSENIWFDPTKYIEGNILTVFVDLSNPSNYRVDISFLPDSP